jgi:hypothetical protein
VKTGIIVVALYVALVGVGPALAQECGNGVIEQGETCDPPGQPAGVVGNVCRSDCTFCGDRIVQSPPEQCDQSTTTPSCRSAVCDHCAVSFIDPCSRACFPGDVDEQDVLEARAEITATCDCPGAATHGEYVRCARGIVTARVGDGRLFRGCKQTVMDCAATSVCGRPGAVTCLRTDARGSGRCSIKSDGSRCVPPNGGTACVGSGESCCDGCDAP